MQITKYVVRSEAYVPQIKDLSVHKYIIIGSLNK